jgi:NADPH-dependent glutamate synthase beta subunit-like oxidoreductase
MRHIAIVGSGPAGYYTAEAVQKKFGDDVQIDIIDRLPVPYGLIRFGVAPDHQSIKGVYKRYEATSMLENIRFAGNVSVGEHVSIDELHGLYDAVVLATGAPNDRLLGVPGDDLPGVIGSAAMAMSRLMLRASFQKRVTNFKARTLLPTRLMRLTGRGSSALHFWDAGAHTRSP